VANERDTNAALLPTAVLISAADRLEIESGIQGDSIRTMMKFLAFTVVLGVLVACSAAFVINHPRALMACSSNCEH